MKNSIFKKPNILLFVLAFLILLTISLSTGHAASPIVATDYYQDITATKEQAKTNNEIIMQLQYRHYLSRRYNNKLSEKVFEKYLSNLDPIRIHFTSSDIKKFEVFRYKLDDALKSSILNPAFKIFNRYQRRVIDRIVFTLNSIEEGFDGMNFDIDESFETDRKSIPWAKDRENLHKIWNKRLKDSVLSLKLADKTMDEIKEILSKRYRNILNRTTQTNGEDVFQIYINSLIQIFDPHSQYFSPMVSENFNINMSLSLEGIGAVLQSENQHTKVVRLVPAGPAEKAGELKPADRIVGVGQGIVGEIVDVVGWRLDKVVALIRGPKGTVVKLDIIPADADNDRQTKVIQITRNKVKLQEQSAKKNILKVEHKGKPYTIGVIDLPTFYFDFKAYESGDPNFKSSAKDVQRLLKELAEEDTVQAIIVDLRNNGGGSLQEVNILTGLFIEEGPIVQVRNSKGRPKTLEDKDEKIYYSGPLAILVNRISASASEIFAGAIQDYGRGLIIGEQTFGKGTVQSLIGLNHGQLKTTVAKFYRISGESTQHRGILPDISYPSLYDIEKIGESALPEALPWDKIDAIPYKHFKKPFPQKIVQLREQHKIRVKNDPDYVYLMERIDRYKKLRSKTTISLNEETRKKELKEAKEWRLKLENRRRLAKNLAPIEKLSDLNEEKDKKNEGKKEQKTGHKKEIKDDPLLTESSHILIDYILLNSDQRASL